MENKINLLNVSLVFLGLLSIGLIFYSFYPNQYNNLELNLGTELLGISIAIGGIDWVIRRNNQKKWEKTTNLILNEISIFNNRYNTIVRDFLSLTSIVPFHMDPTPENVKKYNLDLLKFSKSKILPDLENKILFIKNGKWTKFISDLNELHERLISLIQLFGNKIDPNIYYELLSIEVKIRENLNFYETFPELFTIPPPYEKIGTSEYFKKSFAENLVTSLRTAIDLNIELEGNK